MDKEKREGVISFYTDDGEEVFFEVVEQTKLNGVDYLLVAESEEEEADALILKDTSEDGEEEAVYEIVEDEDELSLVASIFEELLDDMDIEQER